MPVGLPDLLAQLSQAQTSGAQAGMESSTVGSNMMQLSSSLEKLLKVLQGLSALPENQPPPEQIAGAPGPLAQLAALQLQQRMQQGQGQPPPSGMMPGQGMPGQGGGLNPQMLQQLLQGLR